MLLVRCITEISREEAAPVSQSLQPHTTVPRLGLRRLSISLCVSVYMCVSLCVCVADTTN